MMTTQEVAQCAIEAATPAQQELATEAVEIMFSLDDERTFTKDELRALLVFTMVCAEQRRE